MFFLALALPLTSALDIDNVKKSINTKGDSFNLNGNAIEYNPIWETYKPIEIRNMFGFGKTLFSGALTAHTDVCGEDCSSTMQIYLAEDSVLIDDIKFYTLEGDERIEQDIRSYEFIVNGEKYNIGTEVSAGDYEVVLNGEKKSSRTVDWVIETQGETLGEWAVWNYSDLIISTNTELCGDQYYNNVIINNSATVSVCPYDGTNGTGELNFYVANTFILESGSTIDGNGKGYSTNPKISDGSNGQYYGGSGLGDGGGTGACDLNDDFGGAGAGYGGVGGRGSWEINGNNAGGSTYYTGSNLTIYMGSGGGMGVQRSNGGSFAGGRGGAKIYIQAFNLTAQGTITSEGGDGVSMSAHPYVGGAAGGGSGGGILLYGDVLYLDNLDMTVDGGDGGSYGYASSTIQQCAGGGGGGGVIKIFYETISNTSSTTSSSLGTLGSSNADCDGGVGANGAVGVVYYNQTIYTLLTGMDITLDSPVDNHISTTNEVNFNCSAEVTESVTLTNISLWHNATGSWALNQTNALTGVTNSTSFDLNIIDGMYIDWTCSAGDSDGYTGHGEENRTFSVDTSPTFINITYPITSFDYGYTGENMSLNWTVSDTNLESCWYNYNNTNISVTCTDSNASFIIEDGYQTIIFYANDSVAHEANFTRDWTYKIFGNSESYNSTTYETAREGFRINITSDGTQTVLANLIYNGISYAGTKVGNNSEMEFNRNLIAPEIDIATAQNKSFYWNVTYGTEVIPTNTNNQSVGRIAFGLCNTTLTVPYINFTFKDEETTIATNATIDTSTWTYYLGDGTVNKTLIYSTTAANESYGFCFIPSDRSLTSAVELQYSDVGYPQRRWTTSGLLTNATNDQNLYMLGDADGTYSVYQVQNTVSTGIQGVTVQAERQFLGVWTLVEEGETDTAGGVTFWLNPDYDHRLTFSKVGYTTYQATIRPSSSTYTVVLSGGDGDSVTYNNTLDGISWLIWPVSGAGGFGGEKTFGVNVTSTLGDITGCRFDIVNKTETLGTTTGCGAYGGNITVTINTTDHSRLWGQFYLDVGDGYQMVEGDAYWYNITSNIATGTLLSFFQRIGTEDLGIFGENCAPGEPCRAEYSRIVFFFFALFLLFGMISLNTGWDFGSRGGLIIALFPIVLFASIVGLLRIDMIMVTSEFMKQYTAAIIAGFFTLGWIFNELGNA